MSTPKYIDETTSRAFRVISFCAFVNVVMIHSQAVPLMGGGNIHRYLSICLFRKMTSWAVPWFFLLSGYFFNRQCERLNSWNDWRMFYYKKFSSLVIPYFLWAVIISLISLPLIVSVNLHSGRELLANSPFHEIHGNIVSEVLGINRRTGPAMAVHLWFLRSLIIFYGLGCFFYAGKKGFGRYGDVLIWFVGCTVLIMVFYGSPYCPVLFYFLIGMSINLPRLYALTHDKCLASVNQMIIYLCAALLMALSVLGVVVDETCLNGSIWGRFTNFLCAVAGVVFWFITGGVLGKKLYKPYMNNTFWCYCVHVIFTSYICLGMMAIRKTSCFWGWVTSLTSVICGSVLPTAVYALLCPRIPRVMRVLCGGR